MLEESLQVIAEDDAGPAIHQLVFKIHILAGCKHTCAGELLKLEPY
jgi:hypothetical protein